MALAVLQALASELPTEEQELLQQGYEKIDRTYWPARLAAAELLLSRYNTKEAQADFEAARKLNSNLADAYVGLGEVALEKWDFDAAEGRVQTAERYGGRFYEIHGPRLGDNNAVLRQDDILSIRAHSKSGRAEHLISRGEMGHVFSD